MRRATIEERRHSSADTRVPIEIDGSSSTKAPLDDTASPVGRIKPLVPPRKTPVSPLAGEGNGKDGGEKEKEKKGKQAQQSALSREVSSRRLKEAEQAQQQQQQQQQQQEETAELAVKTPIYAWVLCVVTFPFLLCFAFLFLIIKKEKWSKSQPVPVSQTSSGNNEHPQFKDVENSQRLARVETWSDSDSDIGSIGPYSGASGSGNRTSSASRASLSTMRDTAPSPLPSISHPNNKPILVPLPSPSDVFYGNRIVLPISHPSLEPSMRAPLSMAGAECFSMKIFNRSSRDVSVYRLDHEGRRIQLGTVRSRKAVEMDSPAAQPFVICHLNESAIFIVVSQGRPSIAFVDD